MSARFALWRRLNAPLRASLALALTTALAPSCASNPVTGERQLIFMSVEDEKRIDEEAAKQVEAQLGLVEDPELTAYVNELGQALAKSSPRQNVRYHFHVVAMDEPNAFALPGGHIYVSRGLLLLTENESELANVLGHEIGHVAARHAAQRDALMKTMSVLNTVAMVGVAVGGASSTGVRGPAGQPSIYTFSQKQESEADAIGQDLAVMTGIDPNGMASFLRSLDGYTRLEQGYTRETGYFDTHPAARERAAEAATAAGVRQWEDSFRIAETQRDYLERMSGLSVGPPASEGVIENGQLLHPDLDFRVRFPQGWEIQNTRGAVYGISQGREAVVVLELEGEGDDPEAAAMTFARRADVELESPQRFSISGQEAFRARGTMPTAAGRSLADVTWIAHSGLIYRLSGFVLTGDHERWDGVFRSFPRSFRSLTDEERAGITEQKLQVVSAREGETLADLSERTGNAWGLNETAIMNHMRPGRVLSQGDLIKVAVRVPYESTIPIPEAAPERRDGNGARTAGSEAGDVPPADPRFQ
jgi:predicted Zn-dependent protease